MKTENNFEELELAPEETGIEVTNANDGIMLLCDDGDCPETGGGGGNSGSEDDCPETGGNSNPSTGTSSSNTMSTAYNLTIGTSRSGVISQPYDEQWFKFTANGSSNKYKIYSTGSTDVLGFLYNSSGTQLKQDDDSHGNRNFEINTELTQGATYYIKVKAYSTNTGSFTVIVENVEANVAVECISISGVPDSINIGDSFTVSADVYPEDASNKRVVWSSEDHYIASIDSSTGKVTAHLACSVNIIATATDGSGVVGMHKIVIKQSSNKPIEDAKPPEDTKKTEGSMVADPVDAFSGAHCIKNTLMKLFGGQVLSLEASYNSTSLVKGSLGIGWHHNYEKRLETYNTNTIYAYSSPSSYIKLVKLSGNTYHCNTPGKTGYSLSYNSSNTYPYCLNCNFDRYEYYDSNGRLRKIVDHHGFETLISYSGNIITITDTVTNAKIHLEKNDDGFVTRVYDGNGRESKLEYANNCLTRIVDVRGKSLTYTYDSEGKILTGTDSNNVKYFTNTYDTLDRIVTQNDAICSTPTKFEYDCYDTRVVTNRNSDKSVRKFDTNGLLIEHTDENGNIKKYEYDSNYNLTKEIDGLGNFKQTVYNSYNKPTEITDKNGNKTTITYDGNCNVTKIVYPAINGTSAQETFTYNTRNQMLTHTDVRGTVTTYAYGTDGLLVSKKVGSKNAIQYVYENGLLKYTTDAKNNTTTFTYNALGQMVSKKDAQNNTFTYEYDNCGNLLKSTDPNGKTIENVYDCNNQKISVKDANGNITQYVYNGNMKNTEIKLPDGNSIKYVYDNEDRLIRVVDQANNVTTTQYDKAGRVVSKTAPDNSVISYEYDAADRIIKETNPKGAVTLKTYDVVGNLLTLTDDNGNVTRYEYNSMSKVTKKTDAMNNVTQYSYSLAGDLVSETNAFNKSRSYTYDSYGNKLSFTDARGNVTRYTYDANNNLLTVTDALNNVTTYTYNSLNQLVSVKDAKNHTVTYGYDALGRRTTVTDARGNTFTTQYDANGNVLKVLDAKGKTVTESVYNCLNLPSSVTDATGKTVTYTYNALGKVSVAVDSMNNRNEFTYNSRGQNTQVKDTYNGLSNATYDVLGNVTSLSGPTGAITTYAFDKIGRLASKTTTSGHTETYGYNALNLKTSLTNGRGQSRTYTYDALGRVLTCVDADDSMSFTYDDNGNVLTATNKNGTVTRTFDALNRVSSYTDTFGKTVGYVYDAVGNLERLIYPDNTVVVYEYDANNNLTKVTDWVNRVTTYTYDVNNRVIGVVKPDGTTTTTQYDDKQRITYTVERTTSGAIISGFEYTYDTLGRIVEEKHLAKNVKMCYTYDSLSRVTARTIVNLSDNSQTQETFTYDAAGNITGGSSSTTFAYGTNNRLTSYNGQAVSYDADGNMLSCGSKSFAYDVGNKLITADGHTYFYNAEGVRIRNLCSSEDTTYTYNTNAKLSMLLMKITGGVVTKYVYGRGLIGEETSSTFKTYHFDYRGSTVAITNISGSITDTFSYNTYGKLISRTGSSTVIFGYNGRDGVVTDSNGLIYMRARYYSPELRRFVNADIVAGEISNAVTLNRYAYANANPAINIDPFGLSAERGIRFDWDVGITDIAGWGKDAASIILSTYYRCRYGFSVYKKGAYAIVKGARSLVATNQGIQGTRYAFANAGKYSNVFKYVSPKVAVKDALTGKGSIFGYTMIVIDMGLGIYENIQNGTRTQKIVSDAAVDAGLGIGSIALSAAAGAKIGAIAGSVVPGLGNIIGAIGGALVGLGTYVLTDVVEINGKTGSEWIKEGAAVIADGLVDAGQWIADTAVDVWNEATDIVEDAGEWIADTASNVWESTTDFFEDAGNAVGNFLSGLFSW